MVICRFLILMGLQLVIWMVQQSDYTWDDGATVECQCKWYDNNPSFSSGWNEIMAFELIASINSPGVVGG